MKRARAFLAVWGILTQSSLIMNFAQGASMKFFNTAGPVNPKKHYFVQHRFNDKHIRSLIDQEKYFIMHAPRQSGKTTGISNLIDELNAAGKYEALYVNVEPAQAARSDFKKGLRIILDQIKLALELSSKNHPALQFFTRSLKLDDFTGNEFLGFLQYWSIESEKPKILFIDEIDSLIGDTLISVLRQLRAGYINRPEAFPQSVCLVGVRDVRDYRIWSEEQQAIVLGGSAFNIKAESLTLPNFTREQVRDLYTQHTQETGQKFTDEAIEHAFYLTQGQPWLANALAYEACFRDVKDRSITITKEIIERAKETLIVRRDTHIDVLIDRLQEPRVRAIVDAILMGREAPEGFPIDDIQYVLDLGLIKKDHQGLGIANPIYQEVIPRELSYGTQLSITQQIVWYKRADGTLDVSKLLSAFAQFYREHSEVWLEKFAYKEAGPHLLLMAFLQRVINGGGRVHREYALGRKRLDLLIDYPINPVSPIVAQRIVIELKIMRNNKTISEGLEQTANYMDTNNASEGHLVVFDKSDKKSWDEKIFVEHHQVNGKAITVWGM